MSETQTYTLPARAAVPSEHTWDVAAIFASPDDWEASYRAVPAALTHLATYQGTLPSSPAQLDQWFTAMQAAWKQVSDLIVYATLLFDCDTGNQQYIAMVSRAQGMVARFSAAIAFAEPVLLQHDDTTLDELFAAPELTRYQQYLDNLKRRRSHIRSADIEDTLAVLAEPLDTTGQAYVLLTEADTHFAPAYDRDGNCYTVTNSTAEALLMHPDRELRRSVWEAYGDGFVAHRHTQAALMAGNMQRNSAMARIRGYRDTLHAALDGANIPAAVYHSVLDACTAHLPLWHRYWELRRRVMGLASLQAYDIASPLQATQPQVPYAQAVEWLTAAVAPLGSGYANQVYAALTHERWVDIYPNLGKRGNAYSNATYGVHPYIFMNYTDDLDSLSTLAHEMGHAMHTHLSCRSQPLIFADYSIFAAEVASNFNQALLRHYLLQQQPDRSFTIALLEEAMRHYHRYFFLMPLLGRLELTAHQRIEQGEGLTSDDLSTMMVDLFREGYGAAVTLDEPRVGVVWAQFSHLYANFYVYQYASGLVAANALAQPVLVGDTAAVARYLTFLGAGSSRYPLDALCDAGIDLRDPATMHRGFDTLAATIEHLEQLLLPDP